MPIAITKEDLEERYNSGMSLSDIARRYNCTRQYVHKLLRKYGLATRTQKEARKIAVEQGKISYTYRMGTDRERKITHEKHHMNDEFFKSWSPAMAYVLGVIYTDGNLRTDLFRVAQKEPELLEKILSLMGSNAKIGFTEKRGIAGAMYRFQIYNSEIYTDLLQLGLFPNKSLSLSFPQVPAECVRHFIRGCWDGDGCVYLERNNPAKPQASFVSGSKLFIEALLQHLVGLGLPNRTLHSRETSKHPSYYFRFNGRDCASLYHVLYDGVEESMYLTRKHEKFRKIAHDYEWDGFQGTAQRRRHRPVKSDKSLSEELRLAINALKREQESYTSKAQSTRENPPSRPA